MRRITALCLRLLTDLARGGYGEQPELNFLAPSCAASVHGALAAIGGDGWYVETDYGEAVAVNAGEVPLFWACGVTSQVALQSARLPLFIAHAPGCMLITDLTHESVGA